ncbi:MAG: hypothetical protein EPN49_06405 [Rhodanobacter sp.]|nr:MAG: hypothetical protein EPN49_06405 [Rhodanobacter sp.]
MDGESADWRIEVSMAGGRFMSDDGWRGCRRDGMCKSPWLRAGGIDRFVRMMVASTFSRGDAAPATQK